MAPCPCCHQPVETPTAHVLAVDRRLSTMQRQILETVWKGKGDAVPSQRIVDAIFADDPDGGPHFTKAYATMRESLFRLRQKLKGSGVEVVYDTFRRGYCIRVNHAEKRPLRAQEVAAGMSPTTGPFNFRKAS